jgi:hypothetical protein
MSVAPGAAGYTTVYGNAAEVAPLQIAPAAALTAHQTPGRVIRGLQHALERVDCCLVDLESAMAQLSEARCSRE